jgi:Mrr N-terminal domain
MPVIRISQETWERLKIHATPLEHTANDVVNMALDALEVAQRKNRHIPRRPAVASAARARPSKQHKRFSLKPLRTPLLETLYERGGKAYSREIRAAMEQLVVPMLSPAAYEPVSNGQPRWWNAVCSVRNDLVRDGIFLADSERGVWELSKRGFELMRTRPKRVLRGRVSQRGHSEQTRSQSR